VTFISSFRIIGALLMKHSQQSQLKKDDRTGPPKGFEHIDKAWRTLMKTLGFFLIFFFLGLVLMVLYGYFYDVCQQYHYVYRSLPLTLVLITIGLIFGFNIIFNFVMAALTPPGGTKQLNNRELVPTTTQGEELEINYATVNRDENLEGEDAEAGLEAIPYGMKKCKKCYNPKPPRAHHCSVCNTCVLKMDHHCPWINNCVGFYNTRYFILMLLYLLGGVFTYFILSLPLVSFQEFEPFKRIRSELFPLNFALSLAVSIVLLPFNIWNWYLATTGQTTIEFWMKKSPMHAENPRKYDFSFPEKRKNLEIIFGTRSVWKMLLPSLRKLNNDGINWPSDKDDSIEIRTQA